MIFRLGRAFRTMASLRRSWGGFPLGRVELHLSPDIVAFPPRPQCAYLLYGANQDLCGPRFTPSEANRRLKGVGLIYPEQCVDGAVTEQGGSELRSLLQDIAIKPSGARLDPGDVVQTPAAGQLRLSFRSLLHACPPNFGAKSCHEQLQTCYMRAFALAWAQSSGREDSIIASALLGAGARGFPPAAAVRAVVG